MIHDSRPDVQRIMRAMLPSPVCLAHASLAWLLVVGGLAASALTARAAEALTADSLFDVILYPAAPCTQDTVTVFVRGYVATPCDSFISAEKVGERAIRIRTQVYADRRCFAAPFQFFSVPVVMGRFALGQQEIEIRREIISVQGDLHRDTSVTTSTLAFLVSTVCAPPPMLPADQLPYVTRVSTVPNPPCPDRPTTLHVDGVFRDGCGQVVSVDPAALSIVIAPHPPVPSPCTLALKPWSADLPLGLLARGHHRVAIRVTVLGSDVAWPPVPTQTYVGVFDFDVGETCGPELLPYVDFIRVAPKRVCGPGGPICPGDSIEVLLGGTFPSDCFSVTALELIEPPYASPTPRPPIVRLSVSDEGCSRRACSAGPIPWSRSIAFGPLLAADYGLVVQEIRRLGCPGTEDTTISIVPFTVSPPGSCPVPDCAPCLMPVWEGQPGPGNCGFTIAPGGSLSLVLGVTTPVSLAGLEGSLSSRLYITQLEPIGPAAGMHLSWTRTADGVRFVMFAEQGAPIPAFGAGAASPVLRVTVEHRTRDAETRYYVRAGLDFLGSDLEGRSVPMCMQPWDLALPPTAVICLNQGDCDFNADGSLDVRDLVLMVHCVSGTGPCPDDASSLDCDGSGQFELGDVLCCAMELLRGPGCLPCFADSVRPAPEVAVGFGSPRSTQGGLEVPIRIEGAGLVGGARLRLSFPEDRYVVTGVEGSVPWITLHRASGGDLDIGLIHPDVLTATIVPAPERPLDLVVSLALRPGAVVGGALRVVEGDFSGPDGVQLSVSMGAPELELGAASRLTLSSGRPNPFTGETRFSVTLSRPGALEVAIYDLAGRRVATLYKGAAPAGPVSLRWDGRDADGRRAAGGIYFCRAVAGGVSATRRMVMLQGR